MKVLYHYRNKDSRRNFSSSNSLKIVPLVSITNAGKLLQEIKKQLLVKRKLSNDQHLPEQPEQGISLRKWRWKRVFLGLGYFWFSNNRRLCTYCKKAPSFFSLANTSRETGDRTAVKGQPCDMDFSSGNQFKFSPDLSNADRKKNIDLAHGFQNTFSVYYC